MDLDELRAFVAVAETGSMTRAARSLGFARATFQRRIDELEARIGAPLLERTSRGARLTPAGELLAARGRALLEETSAVITQTRLLAADPAGMLHVLLPLGVHTPTLARVLEHLRTQHPALSFDLRYAADPLSELLEGVDVCGFLALDAEGPGQRWLTQSLGEAPQRLLASQDYLKRRGTPTRVDDLRKHDILLWQPPGPPVRRATIDGAEIDAVPLAVSPNVEHLLMMAAQGLGIVCAPEGGLDLTHIGGPLVPVLPGIQAPSYQFCISVPRWLIDAPKVRAVLHLSEMALAAARAT